LVLGAIKRIRRGYASAIGERSGIEFPSGTPELGYVAVDEKHRGNRLSPRIVAELLKKNAAPLFATTDNDRMKNTLEKAGFRRQGREWDGKRGRLSLWLKE
jgi:RimJ/RimL family protein N-acetyltransferase